MSRAVVLQDGRGSARVPRHGARRVSAGEALAGAAAGEKPTDVQNRSEGAVGRRSRYAGEVLEAVPCAAL